MACDDSAREFRERADRARRQRFAPQPHWSEDPDAFFRERQQHFARAGGAGGPQPQYSTYDGTRRYGPGGPVLTAEVISAQRVLGINGPAMTEESVKAAFHAKVSQPVRPHRFGALLTTTSVLFVVGTVCTS